MKDRLVELDILRGLSIVGMILVITPGDWSQRFQWMNHAEWEGYPLSDMIFPSFLFCVGMAMAISFNKGINQNKSIYLLLGKVIKRTFLLILIGLIINGFPFYDLKNIRIPGVLQRIAICYFIVACLWIFMKWRKTKKVELWFVISALLILIFYYILLYHIPVPSVGIAGHNSYSSWPTYIDQNVFGINHLWDLGTTNGEITYDPEGIIASLPATVNVISGVVAGLFYIRVKTVYTTALFFIAGLCLLIIGFSLDYFEIMPIIKKIWTSSFALYSSGFSLLVLACIRFIITYIPKTRHVFYPFIVYGSNAILAFAIGNMLLPIFELYINNQSIRKTGQDFFNSFIENEQWASFTFSVVFLILLFGLLKMLHTKKIFLKV
ncbi:acyltransferase family protein [Kordia sp.]|uniref:acyltransferase family protein n=1 Tax=Kordia sp. TaxID=1965332 RepID=UPI003B5CDCB7